MKSVHKFILSMVTALTLNQCALVGGSGKIEHASDYSIEAPNSWKSTSHQDSDQAYRLPSGSLVTLTSSCNRNTNISLEVLTKHLLFGMREIKLIRKERRTYGGHEGLYSWYTAKLEGVLFHLNFFVTTANGCVFDFSLMNPKPIGPSEEKEFNRFLSSFSYGKH